MALALAGCGGGDGNTGTIENGTPTLTETFSATTTTPQPTRTTHSAPAPKKKKSPESKPGGAGDEHPIATQALFTARGGAISPSRIRVPPFIAVKVVLRAKDEQAYTLIVGGKEVAVGEGRNRASVVLDGLRPGGRYLARNQFGRTPKTLVIVANAEPGP